MRMAGRKIRRKRKINKFLILLWERALEKIINWIYPPRCFVCDGLLSSKEFGVHRKCMGLLYPVGDMVCLRCGKPVVSREIEYCFDCSRNINNKKGFTQGKALFVYKGAIKKSMYRFKYSNRREYANYMGKVAFERYGEWIKQKGIDAIIPVPMYRRKQKKRGYNQAEVFAKHLANETGVKLVKNGVFRIKDTVPMKNLNDVQRKNNLKNAFQFDENIVQYNYILLVDDIYTTGSTVNAIAEVLIEMGVFKVYFMSVTIGQGL